jgi:hypothetical protein
MLQLLLLLLLLLGIPQQVIRVVLNPYKEKMP